MLQQLLGASDLVRRVAVNRKENSPCLNVAFVPLGFVFGDAHADQRANQTANGAAGSEAGKGTHDWTRRDKRTEPRNCKSSDAGQQAQRTTDNAARGNARRGSFRRLCILLVGKILRTLVILQENRYIVIG